jgi:hypothetical protein
MQHDYRGHLIRLIGGEYWSAELIELATGTMLPTTVTATADEGVDVCARRAHDLIDLYLAVREKRDRRERLRAAAGITLVSARR